MLEWLLYESAKFIATAVGGKIVGDKGVELIERARQLLGPMDMFPPEKVAERMQEVLEEGSARSAELETVLRALHREIKLKDNLPHHRYDFVGREDELEEVRSQLETGENVAITQTAAITGLGGIGKTQTALAYAYKHRAAYEIVWWLPADEPVGLEAVFRELAGPLSIPTQGLEPEQITQAVKAGLAHNANWLLVFDNVDDENMIPFVQELLPGTAKGYVLITSRLQKFSGRARTVQLGIMSEDEAVRVLLGERFDTADEATLEQAKALAEELGYLPLALAQAHAFIAETGIGLEGYRQDLKDIPEATLNDGTLPPDYPRSVLQTWLVSMDAAQKRHEGARPLLQLLSFLAPQAVPRALFTEQREHLPESLQQGRNLEKALAALNTFLTNRCKRERDRHPPFGSDRDTQPDG